MPQKGVGTNNGTAVAARMDKQFLEKNLFSRFESHIYIDTSGSTSKLRLAKSRKYDAIFKS